MQDEFLSKGELIVVDQLASEYRKRLMNLSWFMKKMSGTFFHVSLHGRMGVSRKRRINA